MIPLGRAQGQELEGRGIKSFVKFLAEIRRRPWILLEVALAGLLIAWRFVAPTWHPVWCDLFLYLGLYWICLAFAPGERRWTAITLLLMLGLLAIYLRAQVPQVLVAVDLLP